MTKTLCIAALLALVAGGLVWSAALPKGLLITPDSLEYIIAARNLSSGAVSTFDHSGTLRPMTAFGPMLPVLLGVLGSGDILNFAKWLNFLCFGVMLVFLARFALRASARPSGLEVGIFTLAWAINPAFIRLFSSLSSEPLFLAMLAAVLFYMATGRRGLALTVAAFMPLARYAGVFILAPLVVLCRKHTPWMILAAITPGLLWLFRNISSGVAPLTRSSFYHPPSSGEFLRMLEAIGGLLIPVPSLQWITGALVLAYFTLTAKRGSQHLIGPVYLISVLASKTFIDAEISLNERILSPLLLCFIFTAFAPILKQTRLTSVVAFGALILLYLPFVPSAFKLSERGPYNSLVSSVVLKEISVIPANCPVASNAHDLVRAFVRARCLNIPSRYLAHTREENPGYKRAIEELKKELGTCGMIVWFRAVKWRWYLPTLEDLVAEGFVIISENKDLVLLMPNPDLGSQGP